MSDPFDDVAFGSSGIRGPFGEQITPELALRLGRAIADLVDDVVVGRDVRTTGPPLERALTAGLTAGGASVTSLGLAPTPAVAYAAREHELGVVVTASHNPALDNGFKLWTPEGAAIDQNEQERLVRRVQDPPALSSWDAVGQAHQDDRGLVAYKRALLRESGPLEQRPRIVLDPGNGAASRISPEILREAGASVMTLNAVPDGRFPNRPSEPTAENLDDLSKITAATDAVCGLAHDGDGDRVAAVDEQGRVLKGDQVIVLLARHLHAESIAVPVDTSRLVWEALEDVDIEVTPVGDAFVSERLAGQEGMFGGEASGAMIFPDISLCPDGPHAALILAKIAARHGGLADLVDRMPTYATRRISLECPEHAKPTVMARLDKELSTFGQTKVLDGVRLETDDGWALVRPSGTEPKLRLTAEAKDEGEADRILQLVRGIADEALHEVQAGG